MTEYAFMTNGGFFSSAASTMVSVWVLMWGIRRKGELDYKLDDTAKHIRWLMVVLGLATGTISTVPRIDFAPGVLFGWIWATAFLAWPNFAYHLTALLRRLGLAAPSSSSSKERT